MQAIDGKSLTGWKTINNDIEQSIQLDLKGPRVLSKVEIKSVHHCYLGLVEVWTSSGYRQTVSSCLINHSGFIKFSNFIYGL